LAADRTVGISPSPNSVASLTQRNEKDHHYAQSRGVVFLTFRKCQKGAIVVTIREVYNCDERMREMYFFYRFLKSDLVRGKVDEFVANNFPMNCPFNDSHRLLAWTGGPLTA
jgi:hypothetical protein